MASAASTNALRVRQAELARMLAVSRQSINELVKRNVIAQGADGLIDVDLARVAIANRVHPSGKTAALAANHVHAPAATVAAIADEDQAITSYHVAKTLREAAEAKLAQLKLAEQQGQLIRTDAIRSAHAKRLAGLREALLQIPARLASVLAAEPDQTRCHDAMQAEIHAVLASVSAH